MSQWKYDEGEPSWKKPLQPAGGCYNFMYDIGLTHPDRKLSEENWLELCKRWQEARRELFEIREMRVTYICPAGREDVLLDEIARIERKLGQEMIYRLTGDRGGEILGK